MSATRIEILTDEELAILQPGSVVVSPYLSGTPEESRDVAIVTAYRGLIARGIIDSAGGQPPDSPEPETGEVNVLVREDVLSLLMLRANAPVTVAVIRYDNRDMDYWYAHIFNEIMVVEQVTSRGLHHLALAAASDFPEALIGAAIHPDAADGSGAALTLSGQETIEPPSDLADLLGKAWLRADVMVRIREVQPPERPQLNGVFTGPQGSWMMVGDPATQRVRITPELIDGVRERLMVLASEAIKNATVQVQ